MTKLKRQLNLGCGLYPNVNSVNIDIRDVRPEWRAVDDREGWQEITGGAPDECEFLRHDVRLGLPFSDRSMDEIIISYMLCHLSDDEVAALVRECLRVLTPDGQLTIFAGGLADGDPQSIRATLNAMASDVEYEEIGVGKEYDDDEETIVVGLVVTKRGRT
jgi:SAM-dependent methyltransferase